MKLPRQSSSAPLSGPENPLDPLARDLPLPTELPLLPVQDAVVFPHMILPLVIGRQRSQTAVDEALEGDRLVFLVAQKEAGEDDPEVGDLYRVGTVGMIMRLVKLPDGRSKILVQGLARARLQRFLATDPCFRAQVAPLALAAPGSEPSTEVQALMRAVREQLAEMQDLGRVLSDDALTAIENVAEPGTLADLAACNMGLGVPQVQQLLEVVDPLERLHQVQALLIRELDLLLVQQRIQHQAREEMGKSQREYYLREQLRAIQSELGENDAKLDDLRELQARLDAARLPDEARQEADKQLRRLEQMPAEAAEYSMLRTYLDWLVDLPWSQTTRDSLDLAEARRILDEDHHDLERVKERILEFLAVRKLKQQAKGPVLCFVGPPGVGKTSLGRSIARALGRTFVRISLGGVRDEAEIRGHRRTYVGALPGRIIQGMKQAGTANPVFMLDELDKVGGADFRGDPSAALLELLDPEQNHAFSDHYIHLPFDLSRVMFIATANVLDPIPAALKDRLEVIRLAGYTSEEKLAIARRFLLPRQMQDCGLVEESLSLSDNALEAIISDYTAEAGLRNLERELGRICRQVARRVAEGDSRPVQLGKAQVAGFLGPPRHHADVLPEAPQIGVATGLAWTEAGGETLTIEVGTMPGSGQLHLTGQLGDVMKESAQAALSYARSHALELGIDPAFYQQRDIHIHVPAGAIPKDGPSAGVTMATALVSALTRRPIDGRVAMTGEITLRGRVLPVGGIKEKLLAAVRMRMRCVLLPRRNQADLAEIPAALRRKVHIELVETMDQVLAAALEPAP
jgi:ATP-dependent Lon protease